MHPLDNRLSRRGFLTGLAAAGAAGTLAACGYQDDPSSAPSGATWTFTDDRGRALNGPRPARIVAEVAAAAALWDFGVRPIGIFGPSKMPDGKPDPQVGSVDLTAVTSLGNVFGEFNYDKFLSLKPDLLVSVIYQNNDLWYVPQQQADQIDKAAPSVGIRTEKVSTPDAIVKFEALAKQLGADLDAPAVKQAKADYEKIDAEFKKTAKETSKLKVLVVAAQQDALYVTNPPALSAAKYLQEQGVNLVVPEKTDSPGYFQQLSWENANHYPADVIMYDNRTGSLGPAELAKNPTWSQLPAVKAGKLLPYNSETPFSYQKFGALLQDVTNALKKFSA
ncbi:ABC transporter substrate-binding protein [Amycolatopsis sp. CA-230715]|uniref:ABC transporter substrate-binding protein n=1 Tax=Amycolatopsis sp. CA-230715 TaxID=2745196 RepID=UPI001C00E8E9|nr:ABC transporter substrate-binding protein [Amycolatopsis sp. CA-230715]QWF80623.1 Fe(3+)-citrate-binding protein YfmC [Amycolatopsis sp. CA-230715]